jgi:hypothetical protein
MTRKRLLEGDVLAKLRSLTTGMSPAFSLKSQVVPKPSSSPLPQTSYASFGAGMVTSRVIFWSFERPPAAIAQIRSRAAREILRRLPPRPKTSKSKSSCRCFEKRSGMATMNSYATDYPT